MPNDESIDRFYKKSIVNRDKNLFLRVEALEEMLRAIKTGRPVSVTNIQNIINENQEIILPSVVGGTSDPTDPAFTGVVISPSGQTIGGVLYNFPCRKRSCAFRTWAGYKQFDDDYSRSGVYWLHFVFRQAITC